MAQSFHHVSVSLKEAERTNWKSEDYEKHQKNGYNIDADKTSANVVLVHAEYDNERDLVNHVFEADMERLNEAQEQKVADWNATHFGATNPKTGKPYKKRSIDKRNMFPVGEYKENGKRKSAYDVKKSAIDRGNSKLDKDPNSSYFRNTLLQQYVVGIGNIDDWDNDKVLSKFKALADDPKTRDKASELLTKRYFKPILDEFTENNPSMKVVQAVVHMDETNPHMQFTVLPYVATDSPNKLASTGFTTAITNDHPDLANTKTGVKQWYNAQHDMVRDKMKQPSFKIDGLSYHMNVPKERVGSHNATPLNAYKKYQDDKKEQEEWLEQQKQQLKMRQTALDIASQQQQLQQQLLDERKDAIDSKSKVLSSLIARYTDGFKAGVADFRNKLIADPEYRAFKQGETTLNRVSHAMDQQILLDKMKANAVPRTSGRRRRQKDTDEPEF